MRSQIDFSDLWVEHFDTALPDIGFLNLVAPVLWKSIVDWPKVSRVQHELAQCVPVVEQDDSHILLLRYETPDRRAYRKLRRDDFIWHEQTLVCWAWQKIVGTREAYAAPRLVETQAAVKDRALPHLCYLNKVW